MPAAASSSLAPCATSCWRCATVVSVDWNTGANGLSLPRSDLRVEQAVDERVAVDEQRDRLAHALVVNGSMSVRMWTWRCAEARELDRA